MSKATHIAVFLSYAGAAAVLAFVLPGLVIGLARETAILYGLVVLLAGGLGHEVMARRIAERRQIHRLVVLRRAYDRNREDLEKARDEVRRVYEAMETAVQNATNVSDLQEVASEVRVLHALVEQLYSESGQRDAAALGRVRAQAGGHGLTVVSGNGDAPPVLPEGLSDTAILDIVRDALRQNRVDLYLQPIVSLPQRKNRYFECFSAVRAADGAVVTPDRYIEIAKRAGLIKAIDNMLLFRCVQLIRKIQKHDYTTAFFCNVSPNTHSDREFFHEFMSYLESCDDLAPSIIFEFAQADVVARPDDAIEDVRRLGRIGYRFGMDHVTDLDFDVEDFAARGFRFVKIAADVLLDRAKGDGDGDLRALKQAFDRAGVDLIVEKIETEQTLVELLDYNIDYGQGYLFGEPRISKEPPPNPLHVAEEE